MQPRNGGGAKRAWLQGQVHDVSVTLPQSLTRCPPRLPKVIINLAPGSKDVTETGGRSLEGEAAGTGT